MKVRGRPCCPAPSRDRTAKHVCMSPMRCSPNCDHIRPGSAGIAAALAERPTNRHTELLCTFMPGRRQAQTLIEYLARSGMQAAFESGWQVGAIR